MRTIYGLLLTAVMCGSVVGEEIWGNTPYNPTLLEVVAAELNESENRNTSGKERLISYRFDAYTRNNIAVSVYYDKTCPAAYLEQQIEFAERQIKRRVLMHSFNLVARGEDRLPPGLVAWVNGWREANVPPEDQTKWLLENSWVEVQVSRYKE